MNTSTTAGQPPVPPSPRRHLLALGALTSAAAMVLSGCASESGDGTSASTTITELDYYTDEQGSAAWHEALSTCENQTGVTVERQEVPPDQMLQQVLQQVGSNSLPDLIFIDNPQLQQVAETGALTPLSDYTIDTEGYYDSITEAGTYEGQLYGLAPGVNGLALFYNKTYFQEAGIEPPTTWEELSSAAAELTTGDRYGLAFSAIDGEEGTWQFLPFFWSNGAQLDELDSPEAVEALGYVTGLVEEGSVSSSVLEWNQNDVADQFVAGHTAMMVNGSWNLARLQEEQELDYGVVPIPVPEAGDEPVVALGGEVGAIPATDPESQEAAAQVLDCLLSPDVLMDWSSSHAYVPAREELAQTMAEDNEQMAPFVEEVATARSRTSELGSSYPDTSSALIKAVQSALVGDQSPAEALATAQESVAGES
ncbi:sugar ABC transporter substrate-binding protein [Salinactinospora qingdaonensis]|uniref:Sugar ABC transporter substrate-binding protein n=1 Tax=Salinactinospora qingdaonensis TaxID=702744 RepID=A0ABP7FKD4_9ACTN